MESFVFKPEETTKPKPPSMDDAGHAYHAALLKVLDALHRVTAAALGLEEDFFAPFYAPAAKCSLRLAYYPPLSTTQQTSSAVRYGAHTDYTGYTILCQDDSDVGVEYATYCMDRAASYLWGAYSNGPGLYDRDRLMRLVGRQFGEPTDNFPDPASESNYAYRVGTAGLCSAVMRVWPTCETVHACNSPLFKHIGDERSHELVPTSYMRAGSVLPVLAS